MNLKRSITKCKDVIAGIDVEKQEITQYLSPEIVRLLADGL